jgi:hypothetical protein
MEYCEPNFYDIYNDELLALSATLTKFQQICHDSKENIKIDLNNVISCDIYNKENSLLYACETEEFVEFLNGKPALFFNYNFIIILGSSKSASDPFGILPYDEVGQKYVFDSCNFYLDYFLKNPINIESDNATVLINFIHKQIKFCQIPRNSVLYIEKKISIIDQNDAESLRKIQKFLENDKRKIDSIQARIDDAETRMKIIFDSIQNEKKFNIEKIEKLLSIRGGSMEEYLKTINEINDNLSLISC